MMDPMFRYFLGCQVSADRAGWLARQLPTVSSDLFAGLKPQLYHLTLCTIAETMEPQPFLRLAAYGSQACDAIVSPVFSITSLCLPFKSMDIRAAEGARPADVSVGQAFSFSVVPVSGRSLVFRRSQCLGFFDAVAGRWWVRCWCSSRVFALPLKSA